MLFISADIIILQDVRLPTFGYHPTYFPKDCSKRWFGRVYCEAMYAFPFLISFDGEFIGLSDFRALPCAPGRLSSLATRYLSSKVLRFIIHPYLLDIFEALLRLSTLATRYPILIMICLNIHPYIIVQFLIAVRLLLA
jgi:hypothetical protein